MKEVVFHYVKNVLVVANKTILLHGKDNTFRPDHSEVAESLRLDKWAFHPAAWNGKWHIGGMRCFCNMGKHQVTTIWCDWTWYLNKLFRTLLDSSEKYVLDMSFIFRNFVLKIFYNTSKFYYMREFGMTIFTLLAFVGICFIVGVCTRHTENNEEDRDHALMTFMRGLGFCLLAFGVLSVVGTIIYLIYSIFT